MNKWQQEMRAKIKAGDPEVLVSLTHGTTTTYGYGCHCDICRASIAAWRRVNRRANGMKPRGYSPEVREKTLRVYAEQGRAAAAKAGGVHPQTIDRWAKEANVSPPERVVEPCGTRAAYARHKGHKEAPCEACLAANAEYHHKTVASLVDRAAAGELPIPHGTAIGYTLRGCRCDACKRANTEKCAPYQAAYRERQKAKTG